MKARPSKLESAGERRAQQAQQRTRSGGRFGDHNERLPRSPAGPRGVREPLEAPPPPGRAAASGGTAPRAHAARRRGPTRAVGAGRDGRLRGRAGLCGAMRGRAGPSERCGAALRRARCGEATGRARWGRTVARSRTAGKRSGEGWAQRGVRSRRPAPLRSYARACAPASHMLTALAAGAHTPQRCGSGEYGRGTTVRCPPRARGGAAGGGVPCAAARGDPASPAGAERSGTRSGAQRLSRHRRFPRVRCGAKRGTASGSYGRGCGGVNWCGYLMRCGPSGLP